MEFEISELKEIPIERSEIFQRKLKSIEFSWNTAFDHQEFKDKGTRLLFEDARAKLTEFLKEINLFNEWNEFNIQKIGWPDFDLFEVKNKDNTQVLLRLGPAMRKENPEWRDFQFRINLLIYLRHLEILELKEKIEKREDFQASYKRAESRLLEILWSNENE